MSAPINYPNAPITEAIIDLRVKLAPGTDQAALKRVGEAEQSNYPQHEELFESIGHMEVGPTGGTASMHHQAIGWKFSCVNGKQIFQSRNNSFTFSRLAPYDRWVLFREEAQRLWNNYRSILRPEMVERLAVRYINRIDIPSEFVDLKEYFRTSPEIAPELPQQLDGFFMQLRLPFPTISGHCLVNQTIVPPPKEGIVSVVLDIDVFRTNEVPQTEIDIWDYFETLHDTKNQIFEACITDTARRLFDSCPS